MRVLILYLTEEILKYKDMKMGNFIGPILFDSKKDMSIYKDEIGPSIVRAENYETALSLVNDHQFGNGAQFIPLMVRYLGILPQIVK